MAKIASLIAGKEVDERRIQQSTKNVIACLMPFRYFFHDRELTEDRLHHEYTMGRLIGIDLFSGAGGMSTGAEMAGIQVKIAVELDERAALTYKHNHRDCQMIAKDIRSLQKRDFQSRLTNGSELVLFGGPPCQGFSVSNQRTRSLSNQENWLFQEFLRVAKWLSPSWLIIENVDGIRETERGRFVNMMYEKLQSMSYLVSSFTLNASDFGVAQSRKRFFLIGSRDGIPFEAPDSRARSIPTVGEAILDLPELKNGASENWRPYKTSAASKYAKRLRGRATKSPNHLVTHSSRLVIQRYSYVPQGGNWTCIPSRFLRNYKDVTRCHTGIYHRLDASKPSVVIGNYRKNMLIHPIQNRGLSVREAARIQSFPDSYEFFGSIGFQQQQVGNAVPPLLAHALFAKLVRMSKG